MRMDIIVVIEMRMNMTIVMMCVECILHDLFDELLDPLIVLASLEVPSLYIFTVDRQHPPQHICMFIQFI